MHYSRAGYEIVAEVLRQHFVEHPIVSTANGDEASAAMTAAPRLR
jgi:hypothetical protein